MVQSPCWAWPYFMIVHVVQLVGLVCGMALGAYIFYKTDLRTGRSVIVWLVYGGIVGLTVPGAVTALIIRLCLR
jgi:hypothetical protein